MRFFVATLALAQILGAPLSAIAASTDSPGSYNYYQVRGNKEAMAADFASAIADWKHAAVLDTDPDANCRGEFQRVQIQAARDAQQRMTAKNLTNAQAAEWFQQHETALWTPNKCNRP